MKKGYFYVQGLDKQIFICTFLSLSGTIKETKKIGIKVLGAVIPKYPERNCTNQQFYSLFLNGI